MSSAFALIGQKVKIKKDLIYVDKKEEYNFVKTNNGGALLSELPNFKLSDTKGNDIFLIGDTSMYYKKLPFESEPRVSYKTFTFNSTKLQKTVIVPRKATFNYRKYIVTSLDEIGFFGSGEFTESTFETLVNRQDLDKITQWDNHIELVNEQREKNYNLTVEKFGEPKSRKPGAVTIKSVPGKVEMHAVMDGKTEVGRFIVKTKGSSAHIYEMVNHEGFTIGTIALFMTGNNANVRLYVTEEFEKFKFRKSAEGLDPPLNYKLNEIGTFLVRGGLL